MESLLAIFSTVWPILLAAFGIGLVIFVHEAGHFFAARLCKVRVDVFSLGFGPRLVGWRRGPTQYQIAMLPLGGYVKMAGEDGAEPSGKPRPDELSSKTVGQRFFIYSGGVLANVLFGLVVFPLILSSGVPFEAPVLGPSAPGSPAWRANLAPGTRVLKVNGNEVFGFIHITNEVALGSPHETVLEVLEPGSTQPKTLRLTPTYNEVQGIYWLGQGPAYDPHGEIEVEPGSPAARAGLTTGDRLLAIEDGIDGLPLAEQLRMPMLAGEAVVARFERDGQRIETRIEPERSAKGELKLLGVQPLLNRVSDLRGSALAPSLDLARDDRILTVDGQAIVRDYDLLRALLASANPMVVRLERAGAVREITWPALSRSEAIALESDIALLRDETGTRVAVLPGSAAQAAGLRDGDRVVAIDGKEIKLYKDVLDAAQSTAEGRPLSLRVERDADPDPLSIEVAPRAFRPFAYGLELKFARYVYKASSPIDAVYVGVASSWKLIEDSWVTLKRMALGQVSGKNMGGIITISVVSHSWAKEGWAKQFFFLCMLSMNLAFLNVLPIPVLDGGHLFFLLIEKLKGSPVSERVLGYSQMVGIVLILSLMVYVTFNDILRLTGS